MSQTSLVLFTIAGAFYVLSVVCILELVHQVNRSSQRKVSILTWYRGWRIYKTLFPRSPLLTILVFCIGVTLGLGLTVCFIEAGAGSPSTGKDQAVTLPSGSIIKIQQIWKLYVPQEPPALMLDYQTSLKTADNIALRNEADEVWSVFFKDKVEEGHFTTAVVTAHEPFKGRSLLRPLGYRFTYTKQADGGWSCSERQK
jgi:hypothetical protein